MDNRPHVLIELNEWVWSQLKNDLTDLESEEIDWRIVPQANSINTIVRHLRIEAQWKLTALEEGEPEPTETTAAVEALIAAISHDFARNLAELDGLCTRFIAALRSTPLPALQQQSCLAYQGFPDACPAHFLGYHHALHLAMHWGQIRTIRNLYCTTRGEPARFFPDNPTFARPTTP
jgi:uncharacterized protein DUF664